MNGLSLRVSAIKTGENLQKNSEISISFIKLNDKFVNGLSEHCKFDFFRVTQ